MGGGTKGKPAISTPGPAGTSMAHKRTPGPCDISTLKPKAGCQVVLYNLFSYLQKDTNFKKMFTVLKANGLIIEKSKKVSLSHGLVAPGKPAGTYDAVTNTLSLPANVFGSHNVITAHKKLELIAHETRHAYQFRTIIAKAKAAGGTNAIRKKMLAEAFMKMGRDKFIKESLRTEKSAEYYALTVVMRLLGKKHSGLPIYRKVVKYKATPKQYVDFMYNQWWYANGDTYKRQAASAWLYWQKVFKGEL